MKIIADDDLNPNIIKYLQKIEDKDLFYKDYGLKHPLALYNTSFNKIEDALRDFFEIYDELKIEASSIQKKFVLSPDRYSLKTSGIRLYYAPCLATK